MNSETLEYEILEQSISLASSTPDDIAIKTSIPDGCHEGAGCPSQRGNVKCGDFEQQSAALECGGCKIEISPKGHAGRRPSTLLLLVFVWFRAVILGSANSLGVELGFLETRVRGVRGKQC